MMTSIVKIYNSTVISLYSNKHENAITVTIGAIKAASTEVVAVII